MEGRDEGIVVLFDNVLGGKAVQYEIMLGKGLRLQSNSNFYHVKV